MPGHHHLQCVGQLSALSVCSVISVVDEYGDQLPIVARLQRIESAWKPLVFPGDNATAVPINQIVHPTNDDMSLLVTEDHGLFITVDGGNEWIDGTLGEARLGRGARFEVVPAAGTFYVLATIAELGEQSNPLFRLEQRTWWDRFRVVLSRFWP